MSVDLLAFGPHPDDLEIGIGGTLCLHADLGARVGLCDLTRGELGTNGTPEQRMAEAERARAIIGAAWRENLQLPDGGLAVTREQVVPIVELIRRARPRIVAIPWRRDRHPDHAAACALLVRAIFDAGLRRFQARGEPWRPAFVCAYLINAFTPPTFVVDVTAVYDRKRAALACYRSQFEPPAGDRVATRLNSPHFTRLIESRDAQFGAQSGVAFAEGFIVREPLRLPDLFAAGGMEPRAHGETAS
ncbi:MAG TPA: bacillithiol biosynthesis deacetylase BshB1 [Vicinamibacterales bacterium]|nr:bacillithiol biosynthesis deacetylase BshB1 [Vicinamibacterales bacterium]